MRRRALALLGIWIAFLADLLIGAGLLLSDDAGKRNLGVGMMLLAVLVLVGLTLLFYARNRRLAQPPQP